VTEKSEAKAKTNVMRGNPRFPIRRGEKVSKKFHDDRGVAQPGSAPALGAGGRRFDSSRPDKF
jgi:hypothetical protein